jgi:hypothetical protein
MNADRDRSHLVISLGEGADGLRLRQALDASAERAGKPVTRWAREVLVDASQTKIDPIVEVEMVFGGKALIDLGSIPAMSLTDARLVGGAPGEQAAEVLLGDEFKLLRSPPGPELLERWKAVKRAR